MKNERFEVIYKQGVSVMVRILWDKETGMQYLYYGAGYGGGLTPLLDEEGKPIIKKEEENSDN